jgi:hypothetical protein
MIPGKSEKKRRGGINRFWLHGNLSRRKRMEYEQILSALAPCGLSCEKCFAHVDGDIRKYSLKLKEKLISVRLSPSET